MDLLVELKDHLLYFQQLLPQVVEAVVEEVEELQLEEMVDQVEEEVLGFQHNLVELEIAHQLVRRKEIQVEQEIQLQEYLIVH